MNTINVTFCEICRDDVSYTVHTVPMTGTIKGEIYNYTGQEAYCTVCGSPIFVSELSDSNLKALYDMYRKKYGIITLDKVLAIPEKYAIGKRPLSLLLGWGEQTFSRYCDGDVPTKQYSDILNKIYDDPVYYASLLETNKQNLKSELSYKKSRKTVDTLLRCNTTGPNSKIDSVIQYLLNQCEDITPLALQKALYYIQGFYYAFYKTFLFTEDCQAWVHGPVYRDIYFRYQNYHFDPIKTAVSFDASIFSSAEISIYDAVINNICCYSGKVLERFTHNETPWLSTRGSLPVTVPSDQIIKKDLIRDYFETVKSKYHMTDPKDIKAYAEEMFLRG